VGEDPGIPRPLYYKVDDTCSKKTLGREVVEKQLM